MQSYYCQCRRTQSYGSMSPEQCLACDECGTHPTWNGMGQPELPKDHNWHKAEVDTDEGKMFLTVCSWCGVKRKDIEKLVKITMLRNRIYEEYAK